MRKSPGTPGLFLFAAGNCLRCEDSPCAKSLLFGFVRPTYSPSPVIPEQAAKSENKTGA